MNASGFHDSETGLTHRIHLALMPDYNRAAAWFWWLTLACGALAMALVLTDLRSMSLEGWLQIAGAMVLAMLAGLFPMRVPGSKNSFIAGEIFIFLLLLVQGPAAATVAAVGEAAMGSFRTSKRWTSRIISPAIAAVTMYTSGTLLQWALAQLTAAGWTSMAWLLACTMAFAFVYFLFTALGVLAVPRLKRGEPFFQLGNLFSVLRWVGIAYAGSAAMATLLYAAYRQSGASVLAVMVPLLAMLLVTLHFYFRQQEAAEAMRENAAAATLREQMAAAREAEQANRHLRQLQASERRFHSAFTHAAIGMALMALDGRLLQANPALGALLGFDADALLQCPIQDFIVDDDMAELSDRLDRLGRRESETFVCELRALHRNGDIVWLALHCSYFTEPGDERPLLILQAHNTSARRAAESSLLHLAYHDSLTGLQNRRRFLECLNGAVERCKADAAQAFAVMFLDFDRFKLVNDSLGHNVGDLLLVQMARRIQENLRPGDIVARLGGDEFAILIERSAREHDAIALAERLMKALKRPFELDGNEMVLSASIGITFSAFGYQTGEDVLRDADTAMYRAKGQGRASYAVFDASLHTAVSDRLRLEGDLRQAIQSGQLGVAYQPLFDLASRRLVGFEALVRWNHPVNGPLPPEAFLSIAEETGLMLQLSDFVLHCACRQLKAWQASDASLAELGMSINVSSYDLANSAFVAQVSRALIEADLAPASLTLELTEHILMASITGARAALGQLRQLGVKVAVDDFGTGYSSLSQLSTLPIDSLKIDRSFVGHLQDGPNEAAVVQAIIQLGLTLQKTVVAEGIESAAQMSRLRDMGCRQGQGFHLAAPMNVADAEAMLLSQRGALH